MDKFRRILKEKCSVADVQSLFNEGLTPTTIDEDGGATVLHVTVEYVHDNALDLMKLLVHNGAVVDAKDGAGRTPLMLFAQYSSRSDCVSFLLDAGADVKCTDFMYRIPLHYCSENHQQCAMDILQLLIMNGSEIDAKDSGDCTPLMLFLQHGCNIDTVKVLLAAGADTSWTSTCGLNVLHYYFNCNKKVDIDIVKVLLSCGININEGDDALKTPLMNLLYYCSNKYLLQTVKALIDCGADVMCADDARRNILFFCSRDSSSEGLSEIVNFLVACGVDVNGKDIVGKTPLMYFVTNEFDLNLIKVLIEAGADAHCVDDTGSTVLHSCTSYFNDFTLCQKIIKYFAVEKGVNVNAKNLYGCTPLMQFVYSSFNGNTIKLLLDLGADINIKDNSQRVPLHVYPVCKTESETMNLIRLYIDHGLDINSKDSDGETPLCRFLEEACPLNILKFMIEAGADVNTIDLQSRNLLHKCVYYRPDPGAEVVKLLLSKNVDINRRCSMGRTPLLQLVLVKPCDRMIDAFISSGADPNAVDLDLHNALHLLADNYEGDCTEAAIKTLIKHGTNIHAKDCYLNTPLISHALNDYDVAVRCLLENGADPNHRSECSKNVLHLCAVSNPSVDLSVLEYLIDFGVDVNATDCRGRTPLMEFIEHSDNLQVIEFLLHAGASVACKDLWNNTALHICCDRALLFNNNFKTYEGMLSIIKVIAASGGDVDALDMNMHTPLGLLIFIECFRSDLLKSLPCIEELLKYMLIRDCEVWEYYVSYLPEDDAGVVELRAKIMCFTSELSIMKKSLIKEHVSLYDLCKINAKNKLSLYLKGSKLLNVNHTLLETLFPIYSDLINNKIAKARVRACLLTDIDKLDENVISLNRDCLRVIASFLDDEELTYFIAAMK